MLCYKIIIFLYFVSNISLTQGLRFFKPRKKKKECLVREGWNFHYVTCPSKYQKCCETGCCDPSSSDVGLSYLRVFLVCALIVFIFMLVYIEMWCKKRCKWYKSGQQQSILNRENDLIRRNDYLDNAVEMQILRIPEDSSEQGTLSDQSSDEEHYDDASEHSSPPPPYNSHNDTLILASPFT